MSSHQVVPTVQLQQLCMFFGHDLPQGFNCKLIPLIESQLEMIKLGELNDLLETSYTVADFRCGVVLLRLTEEGLFKPGEGPLPSIEEQVEQQRIAQETADAQLKAEQETDPSIEESVGDQGAGI